MSNNTTTIPAAVIKVGATMLADGRTQTQWTFYRGLADAIPATVEGKTLTSVLEHVEAKLVAAKFGKVDLDTATKRASKVPSVGTMKKRLADVRPVIGHEVNEAVALEAYGHVFRSPDGNRDLAATDAAIAAFATANDGKLPSVREARDGFGRETKVRDGSASDGGPMTVGGMVEYLLGQPKAVAAYAAANPTMAATLAAMLTATATEQAA